MQLPSSTIAIETSTAFKEVEFSIKDPRIILEYMRKSIYSNPIKAIVQEIMSNARDAHREMGKADIPIAVKIPNAFNMNWECTDYGPGINPERMVQVFVNFGESTKRGCGEHATDDGSLQTGGFGIGSKTPWAYTDNFTIVTAAMEGDQLIRRTYMAVIADDRRNKLMELPGSEEILDPSKDSTGTTIIVPVKNMSDASEFSKWVNRVARFWTVKPEVSGGEFVWIENNYSMHGNGWSYDRNASDSYAVIDGIPYPIDINAFNFEYGSATDNAIRNIMCRGFIIHFPVNSLSVALSRESIQYDEMTVAKIRARAEDIVNEIQAKLDTDFVNSQNLREAILMVSDMADTIGGMLFQNVSWTNPVTNQKFNASNKTLDADYRYRFVSYAPKDCEDDRSNLRRFLHTSQNSVRIYPLDEAMYVVHDDQTNSLAKTKLIKIFQDNLSYKQVIVIPFTCWNDPKWIAEGIREIGAVMGSSLPKGKMPKLPKGASTAREYVRVDALKYNPQRFRFEEITDGIDSDVEGAYIVYDRINNLSNREASELYKIYPDIDIYAIRRSTMEKNSFENLQTVKSILIEYYTNFVKQNAQEYINHHKMVDYFNTLRGSINSSVIKSILDNIVVSKEFGDDHIISKLQTILNDLRKDTNVEVTLNANVRNQCEILGMSNLFANLNNEVNNNPIAFESSEANKIINMIRELYPLLLQKNMHVYSDAIQGFVDYVKTLDGLRSALTSSEQLV